MPGNVADSRKRIDSRAVGLDIALAAARFLTGRENLHYGLWSAALPAGAAGLGAAQEAYSDRLLALLPEGRLRILDIGGGAGELAARMLAAGHRVEIVVPSEILAARCRVNAPASVVHECRFEEAAPEGLFDVCLFSESFQYIPLDIALDKAAGLLAPGGRIVIADCFRLSAHDVAGRAVVGGGHRLEDFREALAARGLVPLVEADITEAVAPTVEVEQAFYNLIGTAVTRTDAELARVRPLLRRFLAGALRVLLGRRRHARLAERLFASERSAANFIAYNRYLMLVLCPPVGSGGSDAQPSKP